jgi:hypothetical protein
VAIMPIAALCFAGVIGVLFLRPARTGNAMQRG